MLATNSGFLLWFSFETFLESHNVVDCPSREAIGYSFCSKLDALIVSYWISACI